MSSRRRDLTAVGRSCSRHGGSASLELPLRLLPRDGGLEHRAPIGLPLVRGVGLVVERGACERSDEGIADVLQQLAGEVNRIVRELIDEAMEVGLRHGATVHRVMPTNRDQEPPLDSRDVAQLVAVEGLVAELLSRKDQLAPAELLRLDRLSRLIEDWEDENNSFPALAGVHLMKVLLDDRALAVRDLIEAGIFGSESQASEILVGGQGHLTHAQSRGLASYFDLPAELFLSAG